MRRSTMPRWCPDAYFLYSIFELSFSCLFFTSIVDCFRLWRDTKAREPAMTVPFCWSLNLVLHCTHDGYPSIHNIQWRLSKLTCVEGSTEESYGKGADKNVGYCVWWVPRRYCDMIARRRRLFGACFRFLLHLYGITHYIQWHYVFTATIFYRDLI